MQDANGPIGLREPNKKSELPVELLSGQSIVKIVSGYDHLVCLSNEGFIYTMGEWLYDATVHLLLIQFACRLLYVWLLVF